MDGYKHYIRTNEAGIIVRGFSSAFEEPQEGDICILEDGPRHFHQASPEPLTNERGQYRFKWNQEIIERSQQELDDEWSAQPPAAPSVEERLEAAEQALLAMMEVLM